MKATINQNQETLFDLGETMKPESNISLHFNKAVGLIDLVPTYTRENTLLLMEILIFWSQKAYREKNNHYFVNNDNQWYSIPFSFIEEVMNYKKSNNRNIIIKMLEELISVKVHYNFMEIDNTIDLMYRKGSAVIISQVDYLDKSGTKTNKKYSDTINYAFSPLFNDLVRTPKIFANLDIHTLKKLSLSAKQIYQHFKYRMTIKKSSEGTSEMSFEDLKKLSGKQDLSVEFKTYNRDVLKKDTDSINRKTDIDLNYEKPRGKDTIIFKYKTKGSQEQLPIDEILEEKSQTAKSKKVLTLEEQGVNDLFIKYKIEEKVREEFFEKYSCRRIKDNIRYVEEIFKAKSTPPTFSYITKAVREDYAKSEETAQLEEKTTLLAELSKVLTSWKGVDKDGNITHKHDYIGTTIYLFQKLNKYTEDDWSGWWFKEVKARFTNLEEFKLAVKEHAKSELQRIDEMLMNLKNKHNLSLEDICTTWNTNKEKLFEKMMLTEEAYFKLKNELCK